MARLEFASLNAFAGKFIVKPCSNGEGILLDLRTGEYFKLNPTALAVCEVLQHASTRDEAIAGVLRRTGVPWTEALRMIHTVQEGMLKGTPPELPAGPLRYVVHPDGTAFFEEEGRPIVRITPENRMMRLCTLASTLANPLVRYLQALVPKLLAMLDVPVLHAAACQLGRGIVALSGKSGAGKTTTGRALAAAGATLLSEDLVIVSLVDEVPSMYTSGEARARSWASTAAEALIKIPEEQVSFSDLLSCQEGDRLPLTELWFVDARRRAGSDFAFRPISTSDGTATLLANGMLATHDSQHWCTFLERSCLIADRVPLKEVTMPSGLANLVAGARRYIVNSAS